MTDVHNFRWMTSSNASVTSSNCLLLVNHVQITIFLYILFTNIYVNNKEKSDDKPHWMAYLDKRNNKYYILPMIMSYFLRCLFGYKNESW